MMERSYHGTSHLGRMNVDALLSPEELTLRKNLENDALVGRNLMANGLQLATGEMWTRGYEMTRAAEEQLTLLDAIEFGYIFPLLSDEELKGIIR
jgi:hypothetical protein